MRDTLASLKLFCSSISLAMGGWLEAAQIVWGLFLIVAVGSLVRWNHKKDQEDESCEADNYR